MGAHQYCRRRPGKWGHPCGLRTGSDGGVSRNCVATRRAPSIIAMGETATTQNLRTQKYFFYGFFSHPGFSSDS
jgi:hypothetical protein